MATLSEQSWWKTHSLSGTDKVVLRDLSSSGALDHVDLLLVDAYKESLRENRAIVAAAGYGSKYRQVDDESYASSNFRLPEC